MRGSRHDRCSRQHGGACLLRGDAAPIHGALPHAALTGSRGQGTENLHSQQRDAPGLSRSR